MGYRNKFFYLDDKMYRSFPILYLLCISSSYRYVKIKNKDITIKIVRGSHQI